MKEGGGRIRDQTQTGSRSHEFMNPAFVLLGPNPSRPISDP
jgi:hypothetical protein